MAVAEEGLASFLERASDRGPGLPLATRLVAYANESVALRMKFKPRASQFENILRNAST